MFQFTPRTTTRQTADTEAEKPLQNDDVIERALKTLKSNARLNFMARLLLMLFGLAASGLAVVYVYERADNTVEKLSGPGAGGDMIGERLLALSAPVLLLAMFAALSAMAVAVIHSRGTEESVRTLDAVNRLRREGEVAVSARGLIVAFEDQLATARRAHTVLLWLGRTLFIVTLGLFAVAALNAAWHGVDWLTAGMGATSLGAAVFAVATNVPKHVAHDVANVIQLQLIVTGAHRQISLLESDAFAALNNEKSEVADAHRIVLDIQERIERVVAVVIEHVERYADPKPESKKAKLIPLPGLRRPKAA